MQKNRGESKLMGYRDAMTKIVIRAMIIKGYHDLKTMHKNTEDAGRRNEELLFRILETNRNSEYGRRYHFDEIKSVEDYRRTVPLSSFSDYEPYVVRMIDGGEENLITSLPVVGYAQSSGSVGKRKFIPLTQPEVDLYTKYTVTRMLALADRYCRRKHGRGLKAGRGMFTCPAFDDKLPDGTICSNIADVAAKQLGAVYPYILNIPYNRLFSEQDIDTKYSNCRFALADRNTLYTFSVFFREVASHLDYLEKNWRTIVDDIENGVVSDLARATPEAKERINAALKPDPERAAALRREFEKGFNPTLIKRLWPNMSVMCGIGTSTFTPFSKKARKLAEGVPFDYSIYGASEGLFAAVDELDCPDQLMLVDSCYYEFIPQNEEGGEEDIILGIDELEEGREYEIVITNQSGFYRYRCGDVIKVTGHMNDCPYIHFSYRKGQLLNITGEKTSEEHMADVVKQIGRLSGCNINDWAVYSEMETHPYHYVLLLENKEGRDLREYTEKAHEILSSVNPRYAGFTEAEFLGKVMIGNLEYGAQQAWADMKVKGGAPVSTVKPVRILDTPEKEEFFLNRLRDDDKAADTEKGV